MEHTIERIFEDFTKLKVMIIGDVMVDSYILGKVDRISPEAPVPILLTKKRELSYVTHKVSLITRHKISHDKVLLIVNLHAINFVKKRKLPYWKKSIPENYF